MTFEKGAPAHEWSSLLNPGDVDWDNPKVKEALAVNKLTRDVLRGQPTFEEILSQLLLELTHDVWVAHNLEFDERMLNQELQRLGRPALSPRLRVCTLNLASHFANGAPGNKLGEVAGRYSIRQQDEHRAAADATTCGLILSAMLAKAQVPQDDATMIDLCSKASLTRKNRRRW